MALGGCSCLFKMQPTFLFLFDSASLTDTIVGLLLAPLWPVALATGLDLADQSALAISYQVIKQDLKSTVNWVR
jgi:hypothetical protein